MSYKLPHITLLCMDTNASTAFEAALEKFKLPLRRDQDYAIQNTYLADVPANLHFDLIVSPANSYAILDGGFDDAISRAFGPKGDYAAVTRVAQAALYESNMGFLPPGQCVLVKLPAAWREERRLAYHDGTGWGCRFLALCPTMRMPSRCDWDREVVYECVWSLLAAIERHNRAGEDKIESLLMTPLGTGTGGVSYEKWASQAVLAMQHFSEAARNPQRHTGKNWQDLGLMHAGLTMTHKY